MSAIATWMLLSAGCLLAAGSALFSAFETALFSLQPHEFERLRRNKVRYSSSLTRLLSNPRQLLGALVLGDVFMNVPLVLTCLYLLHNGGASLLPLWGSEALLLGVVVIACDLLPKVAALLHPYPLIRPALQVLEPLLHWLKGPLVWMQSISDRFAEIVVPLELRATQTLDESEMETLVEIGAEEGALHPVECAIIQKVIQLGDRAVRDCMTPRVDALFLPDDLTNEEITLRLKAARYRRVPIYGETPDDILGILDVRSFLESSGAHYTELLAAPSFVPETMQAIDLLHSFLRRPQSLAIVVDEHGGTEGIITQADLVEEVFGEALPGGDRELYLEEVGEGRVVASGSARLEDVADALEVKLESDGIDTIGGLVFNVSGTLPRIGSVFLIGELQITVRRTSRKRVLEVLVEHAPVQTKEEQR